MRPLLPKLLLALAWPLIPLAAAAQPAPADVPAGAESLAAAEPNPSVPAAASGSTSTVYIPPYGLPAPGTDINPGLPSSSRPSSNTTSFSDSFDLNRSAGSGKVVRGGKNSVAITGGSVVPAVAVPSLHTVRPGDTLWDICQHYFDNPWQWPKVWSFNPEIRNPNWIYPGDQLRLRSASDVGRSLLAQSSTLGSGLGPPIRGQRGSVAPEAVFLRKEAYIDDPDRGVWGEVVGAREEQKLLGQGNHVYLDVKPGIQLRIGQELTLIKPVRPPEVVPGGRRPPGEIVAIKGTVRIGQFDADKHLARGEIVESIDVIERGTRVAPLVRRYVVVPPKPSQVTVWARVLSGIYPHVYLGQNQSLFIDRGKQDGLVAGNRLLVVRRGDAWRRSLSTTTRSARDRMLIDVDGNAEVESTPLIRDDREFPEEIVGELRIVHADQFSSLAVVSASLREIVPGDRVVARKGF